MTDADGAAFDLRLTGANELAASQNAAQGFALLFESPEWFEQQTVPMQHAELGELAIFLVPVSDTEGGGYVYEAVFTRT